MGFLVGEVRIVVGWMGLGCVGGGSLTRRGKVDARGKEWAELEKGSDNYLSAWDRSCREE